MFKRSKEKSNGSESDLEKMKTLHSLLFCICSHDLKIRWSGQGINSSMTLWVLPERTSGKKVAVCWPPFNYERTKKDSRRQIYRSIKRLMLRSNCDFHDWRTERLLTVPASSSPALYELQLGQTCCCSISRRTAGTSQDFFFLPRRGVKRGINHSNVAAAAPAVQAARDALFCIIYHGEAPPLLIYVPPAGAKQQRLVSRSEDEGSGWTGRLWRKSRFGKFTSRCKSAGSWCVWLHAVH